MKNTFISNLKKDASVEEELFVVGKIAKNKAKNGSEYYRLELGDKTGSIAGNIWEDSIKNCELDGVSIGTVVKVWGKIEEFRGVNQLKIISLAKSSENYDPSDFVLTSEKNPEEMWADIESHIQGIENNDIKTLLDKIFSDKELKEKY